MSDYAKFSINPDVSPLDGKGPFCGGEAGLQQVLDFAADAILIANPQGRFVYANRQATTLLGYEPGHLGTLAIPDIVPPAQIPASLQHFASSRQKANSASRWRSAAPMASSCWWS